MGNEGNQTIKNKMFNFSNNSVRSKYESGIILEKNKYLEDTRMLILIDSNKRIKYYKICLITMCSIKNM